MAGAETRQHVNYKEANMAIGKSQFIGAAGQFYLAHGLALRGINAGLTLGNAPSVDIIASSADGRRSLSFQVKTATNAGPLKRWGREGYQWPVGPKVIGRHSQSLWYAFVDLQMKGTNWSPVVYFVPSLWVAKFVKERFTMKLYFLPTTAGDLTRERWDLVEGYLIGKKSSIDWAKSHPKKKLVEW